MEFSFSMDATPRNVIDTSAPLFASVLGNAADLGGGECVFRTRDGQTHVMTLQVLQALDNSRRFLSLAEHAQAVRQVIPSAPTEGIARVLDSLVARRLLISEQDFIMSLQSQARSATEAPLHMLIRASDRVDASARLLQSLIDANDWREQVAQVTMLSSAQAGAVRAQQQVQLDALAAATGCRTRLIDASDWQARVRKVAGADALTTKALNLLFTHTTSATAGRSFNLVLPALAGKRSLILDEQALWPLRRHTGFRRGTDLRGVAQVSARFFESSAQALASADGDASTGLLREHDQACGATLGSLFDKGRVSSWQAGDLRGMALTEFFSDAGDTTIVGTIAGTRGGNRSLSTEDFFELDAESRTSFSADRERYLTQLQRRHLWAGVRQTALARGTADLPLTIDGRGFLPFALPFGAGVGKSFASLLRITMPRSVLLHLPNSIGYVGADGEPAQPLGKLAYTPDTDRFIVDFLQTRAVDIRAEQPAMRLQTSAALLRDLADMAPFALTEFTAEYLQFVRSDLISKLQRAAEAAGANAPLHWLADLRSIVTVNGRALVQTEAPLLQDDVGLDATESALRLADRLRLTADAMTAWPTLWDHFQGESQSVQGLLA